MSVPAQAGRGGTPAAKRRPSAGSKHQGGRQIERRVGWHCYLTGSAWPPFMDFTHTPRQRGDVRAVGWAVPRGWPFTSKEGWPCTRQHEAEEIRPSRRQHPPSEARRHVKANGSTSCHANAATSQRYWHTFTDYTYTSRLRGDVRAVGRAIPRVWPFTSNEGWPCTR